MGERPAILSRGYGRARNRARSRGRARRGGIRADLDVGGRRAADAGAPAAGRLRADLRRPLPRRTLAEQQLGATVHVLDDGFQHLQLDRDIDLVIVGREDIAHPVTLPGGRLREPLDTIVAADAVLAEDES